MLTHKLFRTALLAGFLLLTLTLGLLLSVLFLHPNSQATYQRLAMQASGAQEEQALQAACPKQQREATRKDLWTVHGDIRLHSMLRATRSELCYLFHPHGTEIIEQLFDIKGCMRTDPETAYALQATQAAFHYRPQQLLAKEVLFIDAKHGVQFRAHQMHLSHENGKAVMTTEGSAQVALDDLELHQLRQEVLQ